ncbi:MAG: nitronate monooxygenase [Pseudobdellovibrionaceae bacterium]|nr:nitronate monooxygenase [Bdellovibrionales bacterium]USN47960.1 MAG: nitronate monooxygenase [Pseudobdellovibrionaceae bacterium]
MSPRKIDTPFTRLMNCDLPIIGAPMFLVSNVEMVVAISEAGGVGTFPALNFRPIEEYKKTLSEIKRQTNKPIGVNVIVNQSNRRQKEDLHLALDAGVELFITSLGNPAQVIKEAHKNGAKVFCDVTNLAHAKKVEDLGADGVIAVGAGAGGHAGPLSPLVLIPWLKSELTIPIVAAGGIATGSQLASVLALGATAAHVGTRFIASTEAQVQPDYKAAILSSTPEDIVLTTRVSGTPASVINTDYVKNLGTELPWVLKKAKNTRMGKKYITPLIHYLGARSLEHAATKPSWKTVWSAGQNVGLIHDILPCAEILNQMREEYFSCVDQLPR